MKNNDEVTIASLTPFIVFILFFIFLIVGGDISTTRYIQIVVLLFIAYFVIATNNVLNKVGYILLIFVYFLSKKHQVFIRKRILYHLVIVLFLSLSIYISLSSIPLNGFTAEEEVNIWLILNQLNFLLTTIILIYIVFEDDIKQLSLENKELINQIEKSKVFVNLGENIAGLVHNLNGDIGLISMSISMIDDELEHPAIQYVIDGNRRLRDKVRNILTLAKYSQVEGEVEFSINALLHSLVELYSIDKEFKRIKVEKKFQNEVIFVANVSEISQVFENLIKNAYEAIIERWTFSKEAGIKDYVPLLSIYVKGELKSSTIVFSDNGPGIQACIERSCSGDCMNCKVFKMGKTTKETGNGLGMISVFRALKKYKGVMKISTSPEGSSFSITLPRN